MMDWKPTMVTAIDGRQMLSDSEEWRSVTEAVQFMAMPFERRQKHLERVEAKRGEKGRQMLEEEIKRLEPAYLLAMPDRETRRAYLAQLRQYDREQLEKRIVALWEERKAAAAA